MKSFFAREFGSSLWLSWIVSFGLVCAAILLPKFGYRADLSLVIDHVPIPDSLIKSDGYLYSLVGFVFLLTMLGLNLSGKYAFWRDNSLKWAIICIDRLLFIFNVYGMVILIDSVNKGLYVVKDMMFVLLFFMLAFIALRMVEFWRSPHRAIATPSN